MFRKLIQQRPSTTSVGIPLILILLGCILVLLAFLWHTHRTRHIENTARLSQELQFNTKTFSFSPTDHVRGAKDAPIVLVEYFDLECPHCKRFHGERAKLLQRYGTNGVTFVYRNFPLIHLHRQAFEEAVALECAGYLGGEETYYAYTDLVYSHSSSNDSLDLSLLPEFAIQLGIPEEQFASCRTSLAASEKVKEDMVRGTLDGIYSTPSFVVYKDGVLVTTISAAGSGINWKNLYVTLDTLIH